MTQARIGGSTVPMDGAARGIDESATVHGGSVPGRPEAPAFTLSRRVPSPIPVLIAVPHAGRSYAAGLLERMRNPSYAAVRLEDRFVDLLAAEIARETGAALLVAHAPRALIDLNRATDDVDWDMVAAAPPDATAVAAAAASGGFGRRARSGLGLIPRRLPGLGELWKRRMEPGELDARIRDVHAPYHAALGETLTGLHERWGAALLIDLHSMPPLARRSAGEPPADFVIGDRFGASCDGALIGSAFAHFASEGRRAAHNRPYAGGYVLERHARRSDGVHALQLEVCRRCYLDSRLAEPGARFAETTELLIGLVRRLATEVAAIGRDGGRLTWPMAAE